MALRHPAGRSVGRRSGHWPGGLQPGIAQPYPAGADRIDFSFWPHAVSHRGCGIRAGRPPSRPLAGVSGTGADNHIAVTARAATADPGRLVARSGRHGVDRAPTAACSPICPTLAPNRQPPALPGPGGSPAAASGHCAQKRHVLRRLGHRHRRRHRALLRRQPVQDGAGAGVLPLPLRRWRRSGHRRTRDRGQLAGAPR